MKTRLVGPFSLWMLRYGRTWRAKFYPLWAIRWNWRKPLQAMVSFSAFQTGEAGEGLPWWSGAAERCWYKVGI